jgi:CRP-like cAMP-binding protein/Ca2+-binding EF-hand superfamily protein
LEANPNKLVVIKVFAPWCKACKGVEPKFLAITKDEKLKDLPLIWGELTVAGNKDYIKAQGILALPSMLFYAGSEGLVENFPCGPSKIPILKRKLTQFVNHYVDPKSKELKISIQPSDLMLEEDEPCAERSIVSTETENTSLSVGGVSISKATMETMRQIPFFKDFTQEEFQATLAKAKLRTWEKGGVIMREGKKGRHFYFIESGEVEIMVRTSFEDPLLSASDYLGTVINRLGKNEYFGERSLITGEPRAASVRASEKTRCFAFDKDDIPESSVLSGKGVPTLQRLEQVNDKYGVDVAGVELLKVSQQLEQSKLGSQVRGSVNTPELIRGVDTDDDVEDVTELPIANKSPGVDNADTIIQLLQHFRLVKYAARCFDYILRTRPSWQNGAQRRRGMLVDKLTRAQRQEFKQVFELMDENKDGSISLFEIRRVMESIGEDSKTTELPTQSLSFLDFMGIMAEAEFYHLFRDTFAYLDPDQTGFVRVSDLSRVLRGMRDLISNDRNSIIDVDDPDMMIDYEQFSRMLLGGALLTEEVAA